MSTENVDQPVADTHDIPEVSDPQEYGGLSVEDDPQGTIDPAEIAGTASDDDEDVS